MAEALEVQKPWEFAAVHRCLSKTWKNNRLRRLDVCLHHPFLSEGNDKNRQKRWKRRKLWGEDTAIAFCRKGPLEDLEETPLKYRELSFEPKTSEHITAWVRHATASHGNFPAKLMRAGVPGSDHPQKMNPFRPQLYISMASSMIFNMLAPCKKLPNLGTHTMKIASSRSNILRFSPVNCSPWTSETEAASHLVSGCEEHRHVLSRWGLRNSFASRCEVQGSVGTVSHISQLSKMFQCFTSCLKSQAAAPMPPSQLRTFTLSDGDSLEPRVSDVGALPINAVLSQSTAMASTKLDHADSCQEKPLHELSLQLR